MAVQVWSAGIDVGKGEIDTAVWGKPDAMHHATRDAAGLHELIGWLRDRNVVRVGLEASGGYEREITNRLEDAGFEVHVLNPRQIRRFAEAKRRLAKNDRADARVIAEFMAKMVDRAANRRDRSLDVLVEHLTVRRRLATWMVDCVNTLKHLRDPHMRKIIETQRKTFETSLKKLDRTIAALIGAHPDWRETERRLRTVPGVGAVLAATLIGLLPELGGCPATPSPHWWVSHRSMTTAANDTVPARSRVGARRSAMRSIWPRWWASASTRCSRPSPQG